MPVPVLLWVCIALGSKSSSDAVRAVGEEVSGQIQSPPEGLRGTSPVSQLPANELSVSLREDYRMYRAAARLWLSGLPWQRSLAIVKSAFDEAMAE